MARVQPFDKSRTASIVATIFPQLDLASGRAAVNSGVFDGVSWRDGPGAADVVQSVDPSTNEVIGASSMATLADLERTLDVASEAATRWRMLPAPHRGAIIKQMRDALAEKLIPLATLVSLETGKILAEGIGEVQEYIDVCDYAVGLSRALNGSVIPSERPGHFMMERWNPLGVVGVISAFNFPAAVYGWNSAIALVCGNPVVWKGAPSTNLTSIAVTRILQRVLEANDAPPGTCALLCGDASIGQAMAASPRIPLVSFTGSTAVGRGVGETVQRRFGRSLLELGGNNAILVMDDANMDLAVRAVLFAAVGTAGQRCTTARRLIVHERVYDAFMEKLKAAYSQVLIGSPFGEGVICGPLHTRAAVPAFTAAIKVALDHGGRLIYGGSVLDDLPGNYVVPTIIEVSPENPACREEAFVPILYAIKVASFEEAIAVNNAVRQGLSSSLFTESIERIFTWTG